MKVTLDIHGVNGYVLKNSDRITICRLLLVESNVEIKVTSREVEEHTPKPIDKIMCRVLSISQ